MTQPSGGIIAAGIILGSMGGLLWVAQMATLTDLSGSDAAGNGLADAFASLEIILLWFVLAILLVLAGVAGALPLPAILPAVVLLPLSAVAAFTAEGLLTNPHTTPFLWPVIVSAAVPPLIGVFCVWALVPLVRGLLPNWLVPGVVWGATLLVSVAIWPMANIRATEVARVAAHRELMATNFAKLPKDAPLWEWTPFLETPSDSERSTVVDGIRVLGRRQADAEIMLDRGDFPLLYIGHFDLTPTDAICDKARALLRREAAGLVLPPGASKPYAAIRLETAGAASALEWLVGYNCSCDAESLAWESMANAYREPEWEVYRIKRVREPGVLGRTLRETPERFDMLSPRSHLKAWLHFAEDPSLHDQAMAGARSLAHRTPDAVEMLGGGEHEAWTLLTVLPDLDLRATPALCEAAQGALYNELSRLYRPAGDDPPPYRELLQRMGSDQPLQALLWLSEHGCDTAAEVTEAKSLVGAYQDSPARAAMLARLTAAEAQHGMDKR